MQYTGDAVRLQNRSTCTLQNNCFPSQQAAVAAQLVETFAHTASQVEPHYLSIMTAFKKLTPFIIPIFQSVAHEGSQ